VTTSDGPLAVVHVLDALTDAGPGLWGKERVVAHLIEAQRASGRYAPSVAVFVDCSLATVARERGFPVHVLEKTHRRLPVGGSEKLRVVFSRAPAPMLVHSHEYKANVVARLLRRTGAPMRALVSTSHAWFDDTKALAAYNVLDRVTAFASDAQTVADRAMIERFPRGIRAEFVANGLPDRTLPTDAERASAREEFGVPPERFVAGYLARTSIAKGVGVFCDAARASGDAQLLWTVAGSGDRADLARDANLANLRYIGFTDRSDAYRAAIDCYVQASYVEGLSLSLLEAMRAGLPIVATDAGSTSFAVRDGIEGLIVPPGDVAALATAVRRIASDAELARRLGGAARERFVSTFSIARQVDAFGDVYAAAIATRREA
jgi:glycosyltransferase involved in cell wall biosynthesis